MMINYSIIIPHKNIPQLLQRCLDSIPLREDVQVIVVDDNSDPEIVDFDNFPGKERSDTTLIFTKEGKGAGYARNVGLDHALGKWLLFIDADDFFSEKLCAVLDQNVDSSFDVILYDYRAVMSDDITIVSKRDSIVHGYIEAYLDGQLTIEHIKYCISLLWGKIIRRRLVYDNNIRFSETRWSNDIYFSTQIGRCASSFDVKKECLYIATERTSSLTSHFCGSRTEFNVRMDEALKSEKYLKNNGIVPPILESDNILRYCCWKYGRGYFLKLFFSQPVFSSIFVKMARFSWNVLKQRVW